MGTEPAIVQAVMRRIGAILASFMVLTFSLSGWSNVCSAMSSAGVSQASMQDMSGMTHDGTGSQSRSRHGPDNRTGTDHCQHATSCTTSTPVPVADREAPNVSSDGCVLAPNETLPSSQSPDLEPPPPKA